MPGHKQWISVGSRISSEEKNASLFSFLLSVLLIPRSLSHFTLCFSLSLSLSVSVRKHARLEICIWSNILIHAAFARHAARAYTCNKVGQSNQIKSTGSEEKQVNSPLSPHCLCLIPAKTRFFLRNCLTRVIWCFVCVCVCVCVFLPCAFCHRWHFTQHDHLQTIYRGLSRMLIFNGEKLVCVSLFCSNASFPSSHSQRCSAGV